MKQSKKFWTVAKFEFTEVVRKPTFWLATLFLPLLMGVLSFVSGYSSIEASKSFSNLNDSFQTVYILDRAGVINNEYIKPPIEVATDYDKTLDMVKEDTSKILVYIPEDFTTTLKYEVIYKKTEKLLAAASIPMVVNNIMSQTALKGIQDPTAVKILTQDPSATIKSFNEDNVLTEEGIGQYILPITSLVVFFLAVFISSSFLLQSVSAEKENRMIETMLSIVDKKSLMLGKMLGLTGVVLLQLIVWVGLGVLVYVLGQNYFDIQLPIDLGSIDYSLLPVNLIFTFTGFLFFAAIMTGAGAVGTGAQDSKNLSSIFILLSVFPIYLMQLLITDPNGKLAIIFSYFPFTSHMIFLVRNSLGALSTLELVLGIGLTTIYSIVALWLAYKLFELGCLMYNRRPSTSEILSYFMKKKGI